jgi:hypothetical protein
MVGAGMVLIAQPHWDDAFRIVALGTADSSRTTFCAVEALKPTHSLLR